MVVFTNSETLYKIYFSKKLKFVLKLLFNFDPNPSRKARIDLL